MNMHVKISASPDQPSIEVVHDILLKLHVPYSSTTVTLQVNPNIQHYKEEIKGKGIELRHEMVSTSTNSTIELSFDVDKNRINKFSSDGIDYVIELLSIGNEKSEKFGNQDFLYFEFDVLKV